MAKHTNSPHPAPAAPSADPVTALAERLFVASWHPGSQYNPEKFAGEAFAAAEAFYAYADSRESASTK